MVWNFTQTQISNCFLLCMQGMQWVTLDDSMMITEWALVSSKSHFHLLMWCTPVPCWQYNWYFATHQIAPAINEICSFQLALSDEAGCFLMESFKFYTSDLLLFHCHNLTWVFQIHIMENADIIPLVTSNRKVCGKWNDLPSETEFKLNYLLLLSYV